MKHLMCLLPLVLCMPGFGAGCDAGVGDWKWFNGGVATIQKNQTLLRDGKLAGKWECSDAGRGVLTLRWDAGFVDVVSVSGDRLSGKNKQGVNIWGTRVNRAPAQRPKT